MSGLYLSSSVAVGDLCMDPANYLVSQAPNDLPTEVLLYYTQCESVRSNPFTIRLRESQNAINNARSAMNIVSRYERVLRKNSSTKKNCELIFCIFMQNFVGSLQICWLTTKTRSCYRRDEYKRTSFNSINCIG